MTNSATYKRNVLTPQNQPREEETGYGYFGARYYDPTILTSWTAVDPMADKYPNLSPYNYCAWNPVKLVDPDGKDFEKIIDHENKTIKIRAQFCSLNSTEKQQEFIQTAANAWNDCSFVVSFQGEDGTMSDYTVSFDINNGNGPVNNVSFLPDDFYNLRYSDKSGGISDGHNIHIRNSVSNNQILAHEMGHCLGMYDNEVSDDGLMFVSNTGNVSVKRLGFSERFDVLAACGFMSCEKGFAGRTNLCVGTTIIGNTPDGFWDAEIKERNIKNINTKKFAK